MAKSITIYNSQRKSLSKGASFVIALGLIVAGGILNLTLDSTPAQAASIAAEQCNGIENTGGAKVECDITIVNNLDVATQLTSSVLTVRVCTGFAGEIEPVLICNTTVTPSSDLIVSVKQCNGSGLLGGSQVFCSVTITNNITGNATAVPVRVNQCVGTGTGGGTEPTINCDPFPALDADPTVTQCNGSGNGGGSGGIDFERVNCTVDNSTESSALRVMVDQCNGSGNEGGAFVICSVSMVNNIVPAVPTGPTPGDVDGDGIPNEDDADYVAPGTPTPDDVDGDGIPNEDDADYVTPGTPTPGDDDGDGIPNETDTDYVAPPVTTTDTTTKEELAKTGSDGFSALPPVALTFFSIGILFFIAHYRKRVNAK